MQQKVKHWSQIISLEKLVRIGMNVVRHGRYITFRLSEVAVSKLLFADILRLIGVLQPRPATKSTGRGEVSEQAWGEVCLNKANMAGLRFVGRKWMALVSGFIVEDVRLLSANRHAVRMDIGTRVKWDMSVEEVGWATAILTGCGDENPGCGLSLRTSTG